MKSLLAVAAVAVALPALGQTYYEPRPYPSDRLSRGEFDSCLDRGMVLRERKERIDDERAELDHEGAEIARLGAALDAEIRTLDRNDANAVANYNARSDRLNRRVDRQNRRVAELNARAALLNGDAADMNSRCENRVYTPAEPAWRDRDDRLR